MYYVQRGIFLAISGIVLVLLNPTFIAKCVVWENDILCMVIKIAVFFITYFVLVKFFGSKKK